MDNMWGFDPVTFHRVKNAIIFILGNISGFLIFSYALRIRVLDFIKEDLGGKLQAIQFQPENSNEPITIINSNQQIYFPTLIYLSLMKNKKGHKLVWFTKRLAILYVLIFFLLANVIAVAIHFILKVQV